MNRILLEAKAVSKRFGGVVALKNIDLVQHQGETLGMIGPNGSGKTTFVNLISGHTTPSGGGRAWTLNYLFEIAGDFLRHRPLAASILFRQTVA